MWARALVYAVLFYDTKEIWYEVVHVPTPDTIYLV